MAHIVASLMSFLILKEILIDLVFLKKPLSKSGFFY